MVTDETVPVDHHPKNPTLQLKPLSTGVVSNDFFHHWNLLMHQLSSLDSNSNTANSDLALLGEQLRSIAPLAVHHFASFEDMKMNLAELDEVQ